jgi:hypothetical protein
MSSDQTVTARDVLRALTDVCRRGTRSALSELEQLEPDLAEFPIEEVTAIHHDVATTGARARRVRALTERVETLAVVLVQSLRQAHLRLWEEPPAGQAADPHATTSDGNRTAADTAADPGRHPDFPTAEDGPEGTGGGA